ncbi:MAG: hypothetical protein WCY93_11320 [Anaerolineaceae bacterium]
MIIRRKSAISGKVHERMIPANPEDLLRWENGEDNIQALMPYLTAEDREFILTGITPEEWSAVFAEAED